MKRVVRIRSQSGVNIDIVATIRSDGSGLTRDEVEVVRDRLADGIMGVLPDLPFANHRLSKMKVSP